LRLARGAEPIEQARELFHEGKWRAATQELEQLSSANERQRGEINFALGQMHLHDQRLAAAIDCLERAVASDETRSEYHRALGEAYAAQAVHVDWFQKLKLAKRIRLQLEQAILLDPGNVRARFILVQYYAYAPGIAGGSVTAAEQECREIERLDPALGLRARFKLVGRSARWRQARALVDHAPPECAANPDVINELAGVYADHGEFAESFALLDPLRKAHPEYIRADYQFGRTASLSGQRLTEGIQALEAYLLRQPNYDDPPFVWARLRLGTIYAKQGEADKARAEYERALERSPGHPEVTAALKSLAAKSKPNR